MVKTDKLMDRLVVFFEDKKIGGNILNIIRNGETSVKIDFFDVAKFDPDIGEDLLDEPEEVIKTMEVVIENSLGQRITPRIFNIPDSNTIKISKIRSKNIGKMIRLRGMVRQKSDVRPKITFSKHECPSCGNCINIMQFDKILKEPTKCNCGRSGRFRLLSKELTDCYQIVIEELAEEIESGSELKRFTIIFKGDLCDSKVESTIYHGINVSIIGKITEIQLKAKGGNTLTAMDYILEANCVETIGDSIDDLQITQEDTLEIIKLSKTPDVMSKLINSVYYDIKGHEDIKKSLILQCFGGVTKIPSKSMKLKKGSLLKSRGVIHILLVGDPGVAKSDLLLLTINIVPKGMYIVGKGASGVGMTAAVIKSEIMGGYVLEPGALPLCHKGLVAADELDKMANDDREYLHEALEQMSITVVKANIRATLQCQTACLAACNPKLKRFDWVKPIHEQIELPPPLISRFDLIFPIKDIPNKENDNKIAREMLGRHSPKEQEKKKPIIDPLLIKKYLVYSQQFNPQIIDEALIDKISTFYSNIRSPEKTYSSGQLIDNETDYGKIMITPRQLDAIRRLAQAHARMKLRAEVLEEDVKIATELLIASLKAIGLDPETGQIDMDRIDSTPKSMKDKMKLIEKLVPKDKEIREEEVYKEAGELGYDEDIVEEVLEKLQKMGDVIEVRRGFLRRT